MRKYLFTIITVLLLATVAFAAPMRGVLVDSSEAPIGTAANPIYITGASVNNTDISVKNITVNDTISSPAGVNITIAPGGGKVIMGATGASSFQMFNATSVSYNCTLNATGTGITCAP